MNAFAVRLRWGLGDLLVIGGKGGPGSGNFAHAGRPGEVGGSGGGAPPELDHVNVGYAALDTPANATAAVEALVQASGLARKKVLAYVNGWNHPLSNVEKAAILEAASQKYGIALPAGPQADMVRWFQRMNDPVPGFPDDARGHARDVAETARLRSGAQSLLDAQYQVTQAAFAEQGTKEVTLARGMTFPVGSVPDEYRAVGKDWEPAQGAMGPLSSWTVHEREALSFARNDYGSTGSMGHQSVGYEMSARVPVERILSDGIHGMGAPEVGEMVVIGSKTPDRMWVRSV